MGTGRGREQKQEQEQELKYKIDMKGMNVIYWLLSRFGVAKDVVEDENEVCIDYLKGYGWMKPHSSIPSERFPVKERTKERLEWMKENDVNIV